MNWAYILAFTPEEVLYGYGPLGVGVVALSIALAKLFNIVMKDRDKAIADRDALLDDLFTKVIPAIMRNTDVLEKRQALDEALLDTIKQSNTLREETKLAFEQSKRSFDEFRRTLESVQRMIRDRGGNSSGGG